jgi:PEP-CTERM motif
VFVPYGGIAGNTACPNGCIAVFEAVKPVPEPGSLMLIGIALGALATGLCKHK